MFGQGNTEQYKSISHTSIRDDTAHLKDRRTPGPATVLQQLLLKKPRVLQPELSPMSSNQVGRLIHILTAAGLRQWATKTASSSMQCQEEH